MTPSRTEFEIGSTVYGQPVRLVRHRDTGGKFVWSIYRDEADQRDDRVFISGLTDEHLLKMAEAMKSK